MKRKKSVLSLAIVSSNCGFTIQPLFLSFLILQISFRTANKRASFLISTHPSLSFSLLLSHQSLRHVMPTYLFLLSLSSFEMQNRFHNIRNLSVRSLTHCRHIIAISNSKCLEISLSLNLSQSLSISLSFTLAFSSLSLCECTCVCVSV